MKIIHREIHLLFCLDFQDPLLRENTSYGMKFFINTMIYVYFLLPLLLKVIIYSDLNYGKNIYMSTINGNLNKNKI